MCYLKVKKAHKETRAVQKRIKSAAVICCCTNHPTTKQFLEILQVGWAVDSPAIIHTSAFGWGGGSAGGVASFLVAFHP